MKQLKKYSDRLTLSKTTNFNLFQTNEVANNNSKFDENGGKFSKRIENASRKAEIFHYEQFLLFLQFSKDLYCRQVKHGFVSNIINNSKTFHCYLIISRSMFHVSLQTDGQL